MSSVNLKSFNIVGSDDQVSKFFANVFPDEPSDYLLKKVEDLSSEDGTLTLENAKAVLTTALTRGEINVEEHAVFTGFLDSLDLDVAYTAPVADRELASLGAPKSEL